MSDNTVKEEALRLRQNIDAVYVAGKKAAGDYYDEFWDDFQQNGNRTNYMYAFAGTGWSEETLKPKYPIKIVDKNGERNALGMFTYLHRDKNATDAIDMTEMCKVLDTSKALTANNMFANGRAKNITLDLSSATTMNGTFNCSDSGYLNFITLTVSEKCTDYRNIFNYCRDVTTVIFTDGSVIASDISFSYSNSLSAESVQSIINALKDLTGETAKKVTFHTDIGNRLTDEQFEQIALKNWVLG